MEFESFANSKRYKTTPNVPLDVNAFESFANSKRYKTRQSSIAAVSLFESFANSKRYKTLLREIPTNSGLRALLIQKDTKLATTLFTPN